MSIEERKQEKTKHRKTKNKNKNKIPLLSSASLGSLLPLRCYSQVLFLFVLISE